MIIWDLNQWKEIQKLMLILVPYILIIASENRNLKEKIRELEYRYEEG